jgi:hypothetical protein
VVDDATEKAATGSICCPVQRVTIARAPPIPCAADRSVAGRRVHRRTTALPLHGTRTYVHTDKSNLYAVRQCILLAVTYCSIGYRCSL